MDRRRRVGASAKKNADRNPRNWVESRKVLAKIRNSNIKITQQPQQRATYGQRHLISSIELNLDRHFQPPWATEGGRIRAMRWRDVRQTSHDGDPRGQYSYWRNDWETPSWERYGHGGSRRGQQHGCPKVGKDNARVVLATGPGNPPAVRFLAGGSVRVVTRPKTRTAMSWRVCYPDRTETLCFLAG